MVDIEQAGEAEGDEMWSFVSTKGNHCWRWHALDYHPGQVLAYVFGRRKDEVFLPLKALLEPFGLPQFYTVLGGRTNDISNPICRVRANGTPRNSRASL